MSHPTRVGCELKHSMEKGRMPVMGHPTRVGCELKRLPDHIIPGKGRVIPREWDVS